VDLLASVAFTELAEIAYKACHDGVFSPTTARDQRTLVCEYHERRMEEALLAAPSSPLDVVHLRMLHAKGSRLWLECRPNRPEYLMRRSEWETAARLRYLIPPTEDARPMCVCGRQCTRADFVVHALDCNKVRGYTWASRHARVKRTFSSLLRAYGFHPDAHEPRFDGGSGPDVCFQLGDNLVLVDVTVVNPLASSYVEAEARAPGHTLAGADARKSAVHTAMAEARGMVFKPLALTVFGEPSKASLQLLRDISKHTADPGGFMTHALSALGVAVQVGNAGIVQAALVHWWDFGVR
jgi:hypothetical protein